MESCPHYLVLSHESRADYLAKVMPPIRAASDNAAVWEAAVAGEVDTIGTDPRGQPALPKGGGRTSGSRWRGFHGIGASIPILLSEGVNRGRISMERFVQMTSANAARIFSMHPKKGSVNVGSDADIAMLDMKRGAQG